MSSLFPEAYWERKKNIFERAKLRYLLESNQYILANAPEEISNRDVDVLFSTQNRNTSDLLGLGQSVFIVSTIFEDTDYYDQTIRSILDLRNCDIPIIYFIKEASKTPKCRDLVYSIASCHHTEITDLTILYCWMRDKSMYQGLKQAFRFISENHNCDSSLMTYINGDDVLEHDSVRDILNISRSADARWITGTPKVIDENNNLLFSHKVLFDQHNLKRGLHVGGDAYPYVMQEGTFWTLSLYREVQGLDENLKLAGDYDLWLQFSLIEPIVSTGKPNAAFRKRAGQKSEDIVAYAEEMALSRRNRGLEYDSDSSLKLVQPAISGDCPPIHSGFKVSSLSEYSIGYYYVERDDFKTYFDKPKDDPLFAYPIRASVLEAKYENRPLIQTSLDVLCQDKHLGIKGLGLDPDAHGFYTYYLLRDQEEERFDLESSAPCLAIIKLRVVAVGALKNSTLLVKCNGRERQYYLRSVGTKFTHQDVYEDYYICEYLRPNAVVHVRVEGCSWAYLSIHRYHTPLPSDFGYYGDIHPSLGGWPYLTKMLPRTIDIEPETKLPSISVVVPTYNQAGTIRDTLTSIFNQGYYNLQVILLDGLSTDATREVISDFLALLSECISAPDGGQSEAIAKGVDLAKGNIISWLNTDDMYFPYCLHLVAMSYIESSSDMLVGNCLVFKKDQFSFIHSPNVSNESLSIPDILDINNHWLKGKYFHQPEVFFTRSALDKVVNNLNQKCIDLTLHYSMDYDLWVKLAISNCSVKRINATLAIYRMTEVQKTSAVENYLPELTSHSNHLKDLFSINIPRSNNTRLESWHDLHVLLFNDIGFFGGAGVAHERIAKSLASYGVQITCLSVSDYWVDGGHSINLNKLREMALESSPHIIICGNVHNINCEHYLLLQTLTEVAPCCLVAHDFWITNGKEPYPTLDPLNPLGEVNDIARSWIDRINSLHNLYIIPNSRFCEKVLTSSGLTNVIIQSDFMLCDGNISQFRAKWLNEHKLDRNNQKIKILFGSIGLSEKRKGAHIILQALSKLPIDRLSCLEIGTYGYTPMKDIANYCHYIHHGYIEPCQMSSLVSDYDVFISASLIETFGQTALEAIGLGKITLVTKNGGHTEYAVNGVNSMIIEPNPNALKEAIVEVIDYLLGNMNDGELALGPIERSLSVAKFSHEAQGFALLRIFDRLLNGLLPTGGQKIVRDPSQVQTNLITMQAQ